MKFNKLFTSIIISSAIINAYAAPNTESIIESSNTTACVAQNMANYNAVKWYRDSAERNAQYRQTFTIGLEKVKAKVKANSLKNGKWAIIMDIDETVLDNSLYEKNNVLTCQTYSAATNYAFMEQMVSTATPGAKNFTCDIQKMGGKVILVTNRNGNHDDKIIPATVQNLQKEGLCFDNVVFAKSHDDSDKTPRFNAIIAGNYNDIIATKHLKPLKVVAYFGDNIQDFPVIKQSDALQQNPNSDYFNKFGEEYFNLPNPTYGSWEKNQFN